MPAAERSSLNRITDAPPEQLDSRLEPEIIQDQLPPFLDSLGRGWGSGYLPSGFVLVGASGQVLFGQGLGSADYDHSTANDPERPFLVGGIGQLFLALTTLRLVEQDKLSLADPLKKFFPDCPAALSKISVLQWLEHSAGLSRMSPAMLTASVDQTTAQQLETLWQRPTTFAAGSKRQVSNANHAILIAIIESVTGQSYAQLLQSQIVEPLSLKNTAVQSAVNSEEAAIRYGASPQDGQRQRLAAVQWGSLYASEFVQSSALDLLHLSSALTGHQLVTESTAKILSKLRNDDYSLTGRLSSHHGLRTWRYGHGGRTAVGVSSELLHVPQLDLSIVVMSNSGSFDIRATAAAALESALGQAVEPLKPSRKVELNEEIAEHIRGAYLLNNEAQEALATRGVPARAIAAMATASIFLNKDQLFFKPARQGAMLMVPSGPASFVLRGGKATLAFDIDYEHPDDTQLILRQGKITVPYQRKPARQPKKVEHDTSSFR